MFVQLTLLQVQAMQSLFIMQLHITHDFHYDDIELLVVNIDYRYFQNQYSKIIACTISHQSLIT